MLDPKKKKIFYFILAAVILIVYNMRKDNTFQFNKFSFTGSPQEYMVLALGLSFVSVFGLFFYIVQRIYAKQFIKWEKGLRDASEELGLKFTNNFLAEEPGHRYPKLSALKNRYTLRAMRFALRIYDLKIEGTRNGINLEVHFEEAGDREDFMELTARFPVPLGLDLSIEPRDSAKSIFSMIKDEIKPPPADMENLLSISTSETDGGSDEIRKAVNSDIVKKLYGMFPRTHVSDERIVCRKQVLVNVDDPPNFKSIIKTLAGAADMIYSCREK